jgi:hypothetical protein
MGAPITCLECGVKKKSLPRHVSIHGLTLNQYKEKHGADTPVGHVLNTYIPRNVAPKVDPVPQMSESGTSDPLDFITEGMSDAEKFIFRSRYKTLWQQSSEDPVLETSIRDIAFNEIVAMRLQRQLQVLSLSAKADPLARKTLTETLDKIQRANLNNLDKLNLTKEKKDQLNKSPETTPSRIITAMALAMSTMTFSERGSFSKEVDEAFKRLSDNRNDLLKILPMAVSVDDEVLAEIEE